MNPLLSQFTEMANLLSEFEISLEESKKSPQKTREFENSTSCFSKEDMWNSSVIIRLQCQCLIHSDCLMEFIAEADDSEVQQDELSCRAEGCEGRVSIAQIKKLFAFIDANRENIEGILDINEMNKNKALTPKSSEKIRVLQPTEVQPQTPNSLNADIWLASPQEPNQLRLSKSTECMSTLIGESNVASLEGQKTMIESTPKMMEGPVIDENELFGSLATNYEPIAPKASDSTSPFPVGWAAVVGHLAAPSSPAELTSSDSIRSSFIPKTQDCSSPSAWSKLLKGCVGKKSSPPHKKGGSSRKPKLSPEIARLLMTYNTAVSTSPMKRTPLQTSTKSISKTISSPQSGTSNKLSGFLGIPTTPKSRTPRSSPAAGGPRTPATPGRRSVPVGACSEGERRQLELVINKLVKEDIELDFCDAFASGIIAGHVAAIMLLLGEKHQFDARGFNREGLNALHLACHRGNIGIAELLLDEGMNCNETAPDGQTALHFAAAHGDINLVKLLVEQWQADLTVTDCASMTPLNSAASAGHDEVVKYLELRSLDATGVAAAQRPRLKRLKPKKEAEAAAKATRTKALFDAAKSGDIVAMQSLVKGDFSIRDCIDESGKSLLHWASFFG